MRFISKTSGPTLMMRAINGDTKAVNKLSKMLGFDNSSIQKALELTKRIINK